MWCEEEEETAGEGPRPASLCGDTLKCSTRMVGWADMLLVISGWQNELYGCGFSCSRNTNFLPPPVSHPSFSLSLLKQSVYLQCTHALATHDVRPSVADNKPAGVKSLPRRIEGGPDGGTFQHDSRRDRRVSGRASSCIINIWSGAAAILDHAECPFPSFPLALLTISAGRIEQLVGSQLPTGAEERKKERKREGMKGQTDRKETANRKTGRRRSSVMGKSPEGGQCCDLRSLN